MGKTVLLWLIMGMLAVSGAEGGMDASDSLRGPVGLEGSAGLWKSIGLGGSAGLGAGSGGQTGGQKVWPGTSGAVSKDYDVQDGQGFGFDLPEGGGDRIDWGPDGYHFKMEYEEEGTDLLADVRETDPVSREFARDWENTAPNLARLAQENLGEELLAFGPAELMDGQMPVCSFSYSAARAGTVFHTAVVYCFGETYTAEFAAVGPDSEAVYRLAKEAAASFAELGGEAHMIGQRAPGLGMDRWDYPYLHNPFALTGYYMDLEAPSLQRSATDYEIMWKDRTVEALVRELVEKPDEPVMSSDLDRFSSLAIRFLEQTGEYEISANELSAWIPADGLEVITLEDLAEFPNVVSLSLQLPEIHDFSPLSSMTGLNVLMIFTGGETENLDWLAPLSELVYLRIGGLDIRTSDVRVFGQLENLERLDLRLPMVSDLSVFAEMPGLKELLLQCDENADTSVLRDREQIECLFINGEEVR